MKEHSQYADLLALYALGALNKAEECPELEEHLRTCAECRRELAALRGDAALLALSAVGPAPPQGARQRLMAAINQQQAAVESQARKRDAGRTVVLGVLRSRWLRFAPVAVALFLVVFSFLLWRANARMQTRLEQAQAQLKEQGEKLQKVEAVVKLLHDPDTQQITLVAAKELPKPHVKTFYSPKMGRLILVASNLEQLPPEKMYELWLLPANGGAPMPCGMFSPSARGDAMMDHSLSGAGIDAKGFAITVEPESGSTVPTPPIQFSGTG